MIRQTPIPSRRRLLRASIVLAVVGILLLVPVFSAPAVNVEVRNFRDEAEAKEAAHAYARDHVKVPEAWRWKVATVFRVPGTGSLFPVFKARNWAVVEGVAFEDVKDGDVACFKTKRSAADKARYGADRFLMHVVYRRTADRLYTAGLDSIRNQNPTIAFDGPVERDNFVGVIRVRFHWEGWK